MAVVFALGADGDANQQGDDYAEAEVEVVV